MTQDINFGDLVLLCGDLYISTRVINLHPKLINTLTPNKIQHVLCTGNVGNKETYDWLKGLSPNFHCVKGQTDDDISDIQTETKVIKIGQWKILLIHGHQIVPWGDEESLSVYLKENECDLVVFGNTHECKVSKLDKKYYINPGTMSGAYGGYKQESNLNNEFILLEILNNEIGVFKYKLINGELIIEKGTITK